VGGGLALLANLNWHAFTFKSFVFRHRPQNNVFLRTNIVQNMTTTTGHAFPPSYYNFSNGEVIFGLVEMLGAQSKSPMLLHRFTLMKHLSLCLHRLKMLIAIMRYYIIRSRRMGSGWNMERIIYPDRLLENKKIITNQQAV